MADTKVSELTAATAAQGSDTLYIVQSGTSKKITVSNLLGTAGNVLLSGNINYGGSQTVSAPGMINPAYAVTKLVVDAVGGSLFIPHGTPLQQKVILVTTSSGGTYNLGSNIAGGANVRFSRIGDTATLLFDNSKWYVIGGTANVVY